MEQEQFKTGDVVCMPARPDIKMTVRWSNPSWTKCIWFDSFDRIQEDQLETELLRLVHN
jgi:hypothetical protein